VRTSSVRTNILRDCFSPLRGDRNDNGVTYLLTGQHGGMTVTLDFNFLKCMH